jgi:hypothetical protein
MNKKRFRLQISLRVVLSAVTVLAVATVWFTPQLRATLAEWHSPAADAAFVSNPSSRNLPFWSSFEAMHTFYENRFVESEGFGLSRVARFDEPIFRLIRVNGTPYRVQRLELVSLGGEQSPVAYRNNSIYPLKEHYKEHKTRPLDEFEQASLKKLGRGRQFVFNGDAVQPRFVGAIRARQMCLQCHEAKKGDLLGAFVYELHPSPIQTLRELQGVRETQLKALTQATSTINEQR